MIFSKKSSRVSCSVLLAMVCIINVIYERREDPIKFLTQAEQWVVVLSLFELNELGGVLILAIPKGAKKIFYQKFGNFKIAVSDKENHVDSDGEDEDHPHIEEEIFDGKKRRKKIIRRFISLLSGSGLCV